MQQHTPDRVRIAKSFAAKGAALDLQDELSGFRDEFYIPPGKIYLDGNSLGLLSKRSEGSVIRTLNEWKTLGIDGWMNAANPWFSLAEEIGANMAAIMGAEPEEVVAANSTTVNLHQLLATLYTPKPGRSKILVDSLSFPSDVYAVKSHLRTRGLSVEDNLRSVAPQDGHLLDEDTIIAGMTPDVAFSILPVVVYTTGQMLDVSRIALAAREKGVIVGWDCSHSIGAVPHRLDDWGVDFAFWCNYKYLNGGPGSTGGLYLNSRYFGKEPGLAGWFSSQKSSQFDMSHNLTPAPNAGALQIGSPNILSMAPILGSLEIILEAGLERMRKKSLDLTDYLTELTDNFLYEYGFATLTPRDHSKRGGHVALQHSDADRISKALKAAGVIPDFRPPDIVRLAPTPLYNSFSDCRAAIIALENIMKGRVYEKFSPGRELIA